MNIVHEYTIKILRYVLKGDTVALPEFCDFESLYNFSKSHGIENLIYVGLYELNVDVPQEIVQKFKTSYEMAIMVEAVQALELENISNAFEEADIDYIPLKGSVVKYLYPMPDYRKCGDIDILVHSSDEYKIDNLMNRLGYVRNSHDENYEVHFSYSKPPFVEVEIHRKLVENGNRCDKFCNKIWQLAQKKEGTHNRYVLNNEALYTYLLVHICKHISEGGAGIKLVLDLFIIRQKLEMDEGALKQYIKIARLSELHRMICELIEHWFSDSNSSTWNEALEELILKSGNFGNLAIRDVLIKNDTVIGKMKRFYKRIFPSCENIYYSYPEVAHSSYIGMWVYRLLKILKKKNRRVGKVKGNSVVLFDHSMREIIKAVRSNNIS